MARKEDESLYAVLPPHVLLQIVDTLPKEISGIRACNSNPSPYFLRDLQELLKYVQLARSLPLLTKVYKQTFRMYANY